MSVKTEFMLEPLEAVLPAELDSTTDRRHMDITTYRLSCLRGQYSKNTTNQYTDGLLTDLIMKIFYYLETLQKNIIPLF